MQIVNRAQDYTSDNTTLNPPIVEGQANPMRRDTVQVPQGNSVALRIVADNPGAWMLHCLYPPLSLCIQVLTAMLYRPYRMAPRGRSRSDFCRSATQDAAACSDRASSALHYCTAVPRAKSARLGQCCRSCIHNGSIRLADRAIPAEEWLAHKGHTRDDRMRADRRNWHAHRRVVRDWGQLERRGDRTRGTRGSRGQTEARAAVWALEAQAAVIHGHKKSRLRHAFDSLNFVILFVYDMAGAMIATVQCPPAGLYWEDTTVLPVYAGS